MNKSKRRRERWRGKEGERGSIQHEQIIGKYYDPPNNSRETTKLQLLFNQQLVQRDLPLARGEAVQREQEFIGNDNKEQRKGHEMNPTASQQDISHWGPSNTDLPRRLRYRVRGRPTVERLWHTH